MQHKQKMFLPFWNPPVSLHCWEVSACSGITLWHCAGGSLCHHQKKNITMISTSGFSTSCCSESCSNGTATGGNGRGTNCAGCSCGINFWRYTGGYLSLSSSEEVAMIPTLNYSFTSCCSGSCSSRTATGGNGRGITCAGHSLSEDRCSKIWCCLSTQGCSTTYLSSSSLLISHSVSFSHKDDDDDDDSSIGGLITTACCTTARTSTACSTSTSAGGGGLTTTACCTSTACSSSAGAGDIADHCQQ